MQRDLVIKWFFPHPPEKVWECLTDSELVGQWLMKNDFKPLAGHKFNFFTRPIPKMGFDGIVYCEVIEIIPNKKLVYTWQGGPKPGVIRLDTLLTWTLSPDANGTILLLEHTGFKGLQNYLTSIILERGWKKNVARRFEQILGEMK
ncbi:MAG TPA: SRPBCC domain-containing protein [Mucilaginibacter sp.]|jgi:uncharacterized protein YndB with AHSA1/START domain|nr:SRPBCC domain-containing protein [Mucilaginibacter sp.]